MHRKPKSKGSRRGTSIDGIVSDNRRLGMPTAVPFHSHKAGREATLGSTLRQAEGFHPMRPGSGNLGTAALSSETDFSMNEPIILDNESLDQGKTRLKFRASGWHLKWSLKRMVFIILAAVAVGGIFMGVKFYILERNLFRGGGGAPALEANVDVNKLRGEGDGRVNILILGIGGPGHEGADLTDTVMLASVDPINKQVSLLSLPRDLWVKIPNNGSQKINAAFAYGKQNSKNKSKTEQEKDALALLDKTLEPVIGIPIHYHAVVDFVAFQQTVDALGGVTINVPETLYDPSIAWENNGNPVIAQKGTTEFNGAKALLYVKSRQTSTDFARSERQRLIVVALKDKILSAGTFANPIRISQLMDSLGDNIYTDFTLNDIRQLYEVVAKIPSSNIASLDLVTPPHDLLTTSSLNGFSIVRPKAGLYDYGPLQSYVRNALRDSFLIKEDAAVAIYNATSTTGMATKKADLLKSYGYKVTVVETAPKTTDPFQTTLVDLSSSEAKYTRHYLEQRLSVKAMGKIPPEYGITPPAETKFVIILGKDAIDN
ncbi:LCP family protein [Candidatus Saccharibacteria bacterium]|nr:LCP family protein [Candidatus Saccharibacteria bacterium]